MSESNLHSSLHMIQLWLDASRLAQLGRMLHLPIARTSTRYLVHCALGELFQAQAPKPFSVERPNSPTRSADEQSGRFIRILGYSELDHIALQRLAQGFAGPAVYRLCDWGRCVSKPMPDTFPIGMNLAFGLQACPVIRKASDGAKWKAGQEVDVFLAKAWTLEAIVNISREEVYSDWLKTQFERRGGADLISTSVERFSIERMTRRTEGSDRIVRTIQRPDVTFSGMLKVADEDRFVDMLQKGIGRHRSFGYGMLKLRRAD